MQYWARDLASDYQYHGRQQEAPGSPGLASSTRLGRANDEINAHSSMFVAMTGTVVVVASVTSSVTHTMLASDIRRGINERSRRLDWEDHCEDPDERGSTVLGVSTGCLSRPSKKLADILRLQPLRDRRFLALYLTRGWAAYISSAVQRESVFYRQFRTLRSPIAQSDSKIPCRYHFQVDYELCECDVLLSFKTEIVSTSFYSIIFNIADERLNLGKFDFNTLVSDELR